LKRTAPSTRDLEQVEVMGRVAEEGLKWWMQQPWSIMRGCAAGCRRRTSGVGGKGRNTAKRKERKEHFGDLVQDRAEVEMKLNDALVRNWSCGYTLGMKTAISIPNDLFDGAERLARRTRRSRSRLFTDALREYLTRHAPDKITESMDQAIMEVGEGKDEFVSSIARRRLERTEW
jgi:predicted transcriptional regulator